MKFYLAARLSRAEELRSIRDEVHAKGGCVTSRWIEGGHEIASAEGDVDRGQARTFALEDVADVMDADTVIVFTEEPRTTNSRGGRHVEFGIAIGAGKAVVVIGPRENVFTHLPGVKHFPAWDDDARFYVLNIAHHSPKCSFWPESGWECSYDCGNDRVLPAEVTT